MPSKTDDAAACTLSQAINTATRPVHTKLNKLIVFRLPLALPPQTDDGSNYVSGLLHVAPIYIAFESLWGKIVQSSASSSESPEPSTDALECQAHQALSGEPAGNDGLDLHTLPEVMASSNVPATSSRIRTILTDLSFPEMRRTQALQSDLMALTGWSSCTLAKHLNDAAEAPVLSSFLHHIRHAVESRPHVLLAYGWVLYMALFSGGRFIRASLEAAGPAFWAPPSEVPRSYLPTSSSEQQNPEQNAACPLQFFRFDTPDDGEDLKQMFKQRLLELEVLLNDKERNEIVAEAQSIFDFMMRMVMELDEVCGTAEDAGNKLLGLRSRDSVVVEKERRQMAELTKKTAHGQSGISSQGQVRPAEVKRRWLRFL
ncbi:heme oxygenase 2 [Microdochium nivale]|nr:heme oxygenase 2 [Microdochium nivale]